MNSTGEGTGVQQAHAQLNACHWLSSSPWSSHFLHIPQCNSTVRELYRFHITDDRNRILYNLICKFYSEQLKTNKQTKRSAVFCSHRNSHFLLWKVHSQDSNEATEYKACQNLLHCDFCNRFLSLKYAFRSVLSYLYYICN